jgi:hypothetical protein
VNQSAAHTKKKSGEMQDDLHSYTALKCTYGSIQNSELHQAMETGTVPSEHLYFILIFTQLARNPKLSNVKLGAVCFTNKSP